MPKASDILLEYQQEGRKTWSIRFYRDGLVEEYSDTMMEFEDGKIVTHSIPLEWRDATHLVQPELDRVIAAIRQADFFNLPAQIGNPKQVHDGVIYTWTANLDGRSQTVQAVGPEASSHPALKLLNLMIQEVTADAFEREAGADSGSQPAS